MATDRSSVSNNNTSGFIDFSLSDSSVTSKLNDYIWYSGSTETAESYRSVMDSILRYENENPRIPMKVVCNVKTRVRPFGLKPSRNVRIIKQFTGHSFKVGKSKK